MQTFSNGFDQAIAACIEKNGETLVYASTTCTWQGTEPVTREFPDSIRARTYNTAMFTAEEALGIKTPSRRVRWDEFSAAMASAV